ncbi:MAG TPA: DUF1223 domain-containing protein [Bryobacteraceae bacterium]|nr:DUF1223 domain-containing protein [Bryobacteraceae bacterium]
MRLFAVLFFLTYGVAGSYGRPADAQGARSPVLVELFTSECCSSFPPIDALVQQLDASQPFPNAQLIVLSEHVDYWNHDGWKDPYSSSLFTERQNAYVHALGLSEPYTPQIVVDGNEVLKSYTPQQISQIFEKAAAAPQIPVHIVALSVEDKGQPVVQARIEADGEAVSHNADVYLAVALEHAESQVSAGENNGKRLTHVAVVQYLKRLGRLESGKSFGQDCQVKLKKGTDPANLRVVAFVQEPGPGKVLGTVLRKPATNLMSSR